MRFKVLKIYFNFKASFFYIKIKDFMGNIMDSDKEKIEKMHKHYKEKIIPNCTKCGTNTNVIPAVFGKPNKDLL